MVVNLVLFPLAICDTGSLTQITVPVPGAGCDTQIPRIIY